MELKIRLTDREREILQHFSVGKTTKEVMREFHYSESELTSILEKIYLRFKVRKTVGSREEAVCHAILLGLIIGPKMRFFPLDSLTEDELTAAKLLPIMFKDQLIANEMGHNSRESAAKLLSDARIKMRLKTRTHQAAVMIKFALNMK